MRTELGNAAIFEEGRLVGMEVDGGPLVLDRYEGQSFVMDGGCSHAVYDLSK